MKYNRIEVLEKLLQENIDAFNKGLSDGKVTHPNIGSKLSSSVDRYYEYLENIEFLQNRILNLKQL